MQPGWVKPLTCRKRLDHDTGWFVPNKSPQPLPKATFKDRNGNDHGFGELHGHPLLVHLWGSWCPPCIEELPSFDRLQKALWNEQLRVVAVGRDRGGPPFIDALYEEHRIQYLPVFTDRWGKLAHRLDAKAVPITLHVDAKGREVGRYYGTAPWDSEENRAHIFAIALACQASPDETKRSNPARRIPGFSSKDFG